MTIQPDAIVCGAKAHECRCDLQPGHDRPPESSPHLCSHDGGQWTGEYGTDTFHVVRYPNIFWVHEVDE